MKYETSPRYKHDFVVNLNDKIKKISKINDNKKLILKKIENMNLSESGISDVIDLYTDFNNVNIILADYKLADEHDNVADSQLKEIWNDIVKKEILNPISEISSIKQKLEDKVEKLIINIEDQFISGVKNNDYQIKTSAENKYQNLKKSIPELIKNHKLRELKNYSEFKEEKSKLEERFNDLSKINTFPSKKELEGINRELFTLSVELDNLNREKKRKSDLKNLYSTDVFKDKLDNIYSQAKDTLNMYDSIKNALLMVDENLVKIEKDEKLLRSLSINHLDIDKLNNISLKLVDYKLDFPKNEFIWPMINVSKAEYEFNLESLSNKINSKRKNLVLEADKELEKLYSDYPKEPQSFDEIENFLKNSRDFRMSAIGLDEILKKLEDPKKVKMPSRSEMQAYEKIIHVGKNIEMTITKVQKDNERVKHILKKINNGEDHELYLSQIKEIDKKITENYNKYDEFKSEKLLKDKYFDLGNKMIEIKYNIGLANKNISKKTKKNREQKRERKENNYSIKKLTELENKLSDLDSKVSEIDETKPRIKEYREYINSKLKTERFSLPLYVSTIKYPENFRLLPLRNILAAEAGGKDWNERFSMAKNEVNKLKVTNENDKIYLSKLAHGIKKAVDSNYSGIPEQIAIECYNKLNNLAA